MKPMVTFLMAFALAACGTNDAKTGLSPNAESSPFAGKSFAGRCDASDPQNSTANDSTFYAVSGNKEDPFKSVAILTLSSGYVCSGVLVGPDRLLTAAHCFEDKATIQSIEFKDSVGKRPLSVLYSKTILHPDYASALGRGESLEKNPALVNVDIAVIVLSTTIKDRDPISMSASDHMSPGQLVSLVGYGDSGHGAGVKRFAQSHVGRRIDTENIGGYQFKDLIALDSTSGTGACPGDSGGGLFAKDDHGYRLLGLISGVNNLIYPGFPVTACGGCPQGLGIAILLSGSVGFLAAQGVGIQ